MGCISWLRVSVIDFFIADIILYFSYFHVELFKLSSKLYQCSIDSDQYAACSKERSEGTCSVKTRLDHNSRKSPPKTVATYRTFNI